MTGKRLEQSDLGKVRVVIATTAGPREVISLRPWSGTKNHSTMELSPGRRMPNTRKVEVPVSGDYRQFVEPATGIIAHIFGEPSYQLQVSDPIDDGKSFQLGAFLAHALRSAGCLAQHGEAADTILWATGEVGADRAIGRVDGIALKWRQSATFWEETQRTGKTVILCVPPDAETRKELNEAGVPGGARVEACLDVINLLERLGFRVPPDFWDLNRAWTKNPYPGLTRFTTEHRPVFAGRLAARAELLNRLAKLRAGERPTPFLAITGDSGVGKSSILWAGLLGDLEDRERADGPSAVTWMTKEIQVQQGDLHPVAALRAGLATLFLDLEQTALELNEEGSSPLAALRDTLAAFIPDLEPAALDRLDLEALERGAAVVGRALAEACTRDPGPLKRLVLVIDPLDRLLVEKGKAETATRLAAALRGLIAGAAGNVIVLATVRSELAGHMGGGGVFSGLGGGDHIYNLAAPTDVEYREIIELPARWVGWSLEDGMAERLAAVAARQPYALPLLQELLHQRYEACSAAGGQKTLTLGGEASDMLAGVIAHTAEGVWRSVDGSDSQREAALVGLLARLVVTEDDEGPIAGKAPVTRAISLDEIPQGSTERLLAEALREARLLVSEHRAAVPGTATGEGGDGEGGRKGEVTYISVAHDSLLSHWPRASTALRDRGDTIRDLRMVNEALDKWRKNRKVGLLRSPDLERAQNLRKAPAVELDSDTLDFISKSSRSARIGRIVAGAVFALVMVLAVGVAVTNVKLESTIAALEDSNSDLVQQRLEAQENESLALIEQAERVLDDGDWNQAVRLVRDALPDPRADFADRPLVRKAAALALELLARPGFRIQYQPLAGGPFNGVLAPKRHVQFADDRSNDIIIVDDAGIGIISNATAHVHKIADAKRIRDEYGKDYSGYSIIGPRLVRVYAPNGEKNDLFFHIDARRRSLERIPFESPPLLLASPSLPTQPPHSPPDLTFDGDILGDVLAVSGDGNVVAVRSRRGNDVVSIWSNKGKEWRPHRYETGRNITDLALSYGGNVAAVASIDRRDPADTKIEVFDLRNGEIWGAISVDDTVLTDSGITVSELGGIVVVNTESGAKLYNYLIGKTGTFTASYGSRVKVTCVKVGTRGDRLVWNENGNAVYANLDRDNLEINGAYNTLVQNDCNISMSSNERYLVVGESTATSIWDMNVHLKISNIGGSRVLDSHASFPARNRLALTGQDQTYLEVLSLGSLAQYDRSDDLEMYLGSTLSNEDELRFEDDYWQAYPINAPWLPATRFSVDVALAGDGLQPHLDFDRCRFQPERPQEDLIVWSCSGTRFQLKIGRTSEREHDRDRLGIGQFVVAENARLIAFLLDDDTKLYLADLSENELRLVQAAPTGYKIGILGFSADGRKLATLCRPDDSSGQYVPYGRAPSWSVIVSGCYNTVTIRDTASAEIVGRIHGGGDKFRGFGFNADSKYYYGSIRGVDDFSLFDASSGRKIIEYVPTPIGIYDRDTSSTGLRGYLTAISPLGTNAVIYGIYEGASDPSDTKSIGTFFSFDLSMIRTAAALGLTVTFDQTGVQDVRVADDVSNKITMSDEARQLIEIFDLIALEPRSNSRSLSSAGLASDSCGVADQFADRMGEIEAYIFELTSDQAQTALLAECRDAVARDPDNARHLAGYGFFLARTSADPTEGLAELQRAIDLGDPLAPRMKWLAMRALGVKAIGTHQERLALLAEGCKRGDQPTCTSYLAMEYWAEAEAADESRQQVLRDQAEAIWRRAAAAGDALSHEGLAKANAVGVGVSPERMREDVLYHHLMATELLHETSTANDPHLVSESRAKANIARTMIVEGQIDDLLRIARQARADAQAVIRQQKLIPGSFEQVGAAP